MLRDALLVFNEHGFNIGLGLLFEGRCDVTIESFVVNSVIVVSKIFLEAEKKLL